MLTEPFKTTASSGPRHRAAPVGDANAPVVLDTAGVYAMRDPVARDKVTLAIYPARPDGRTFSDDAVFVQLNPRDALNLRDFLNRGIAGDGTALPDPNDLAGLSGRGRRRGGGGGYYSLPDSMSSSSASARIASSTSAPTPSGKPAASLKDSGRSAHTATSVTARQFTITTRPRSWLTRPLTTFLSIIRPTKSAASAKDPASSRRSYSNERLVTQYVSTGSPSVGGREAPSVGAGVPERRVALRHPNPARVATS